MTAKFFTYNLIPPSCWGKECADKLDSHFNVPAPVNTKVI